MTKKEFTGRWKYSKRRGAWIWKWKYRKPRKVEGALQEKP
jgi:hypothetical protein